MNNSLVGKYYLVTGGAGVGSGVCRVLKQQGANLIIHEKTQANWTPLHPAAPTPT